MLRFLQNARDSGLPVFFCQHQLTGRINVNFLQIFDGALAFRVERADGIDLVVPELDPERVFLCQRKNIYDSAADGKLPACTDLVILFIAEFCQVLCQMNGIHDIAGGDFHDRLDKGLGGRHRVHKSVKCSENSTLFFFRQKPEGADALRRQNISADV